MEQLTQSNQARQLLPFQLDLQVIEQDYAITFNPVFGSTF